MSARRRLKRKWLLLAALVFIGLLLVALGKLEPRFEGRSLSYWLDSLPSIDIGSDGRSESIGLPTYGLVFTNDLADTAQMARNVKNAQTGFKAVTALGTNHLHRLVKRLQAKDSATMLWMWRLAERLGIAEFPEYRYAKFRRGQALSAFQHLGSRAMPAVPQLLELTGHPDPNIQLVAWSALERVSPEEFRKQPHPPIIEHERTAR
ncbi:MAG TPA: hypothetical protein VFZ59_19980 [Verrucomicrobiae bacterium]|nr:hypothetical protein [Verrucomicrobiae bacterium]